MKVYCALPDKGCLKLKKSELCIKLRKETEEKVLVEKQMMWFCYF